MNDQLYTHKLDNLDDEMGKFLETPYLLTLNHQKNRKSGLTSK